MFQSKSTRRTLASLLALGVYVLAVASPLQAADDSLTAAEADSTLTQPVALAPRADREESLLPDSKLETIAALSVPEIAPRVKQHVLPEYPVFARRARIQGMVYAHVLVDKDGRVAQVRRVTGQAVFHEAAKTAVKRWEFSPAMQGDVPVKAWVTVPLSFEM